MLTEKLNALGVKGRQVGQLQRGETVRVGDLLVRPEDVSVVKEGRCLVTVFDTRLCQSAVDLARDADVLVCESQFESSLQEKADAFMHMTVTDACRLAQLAGVKRLVLSHFSQRYKTLDVIEDQAKAAFGNVELARDFLVVKV
ncbi:MAG: hypothetical protein HC945_04475 [Nitrosarchaeum sp.]|nr:hypothetical protein [Nitrosarchaeum sp.]